MEKIRKISTVYLLILLTILFACSKENKELENEYTSDDNSTNELTSEENEEILDEDFNPDEVSKLCVIIDDFGNYNNFMLDSLLLKFASLPREVNFAILPNLPYSEFVMEYCAGSGRELLLHTPMQALNEKINAGEAVINVDDDEVTIINKLNDFYSNLPRVSGLNNHMGSKATADSLVMTTVLEWCKANDLFFVDSATIANSLAFSLAQEIGVPTAKRDIFLDVPNPSKENIDKYLEKMKYNFSQGKNILVITHASTLERMENLDYFIEKCRDIGYQLVPISEYLIYPDHIRIFPEKAI